MLKRFLGSIIFVLPLIISAQGIKFENNLGWEQLKQKAKAENKYIFIDAYASWCIPCKKMENEVFQVKQVGDYINTHFISVRMQMDTSKNDDENIKAMYDEAHALQQQYNIIAFPTYLFFSPEGNIVHRYSGAMQDSLFLKLTANALNPEKQYYSLLDAYKKGQKDYSKLSYLANISVRIGEDSLANRIALDYLHNYINKLPEKELLLKKHLDFVTSFSSILSSNDKPFQLFYKEGKKIDDILGKQGMSKFIVLDIITKEEIQPRIWPNKKAIAIAPNWDVLTSILSKKYNSYYTDLAVLDAQLKWFKQKKDRQQEIKYTVRMYETYGLDTAGIGWALINNTLDALFFKYCNDKDTLNKAIGWMEMILKAHPDDWHDIDTYANLLYKVGRKEEAINWERKALQMEIEAAKKDSRDPNPEYQETLDKMKKGIPTWVSN